MRKRKLQTSVIVIQRAHEVKPGAVDDETGGQLALTVNESNPVRIRIVLITHVGNHLSKGCGYEC